jgi:isopropanol dehydrogenase (NADP+)
MKAFVMREIGAVGMMDKPVPSAGPNDAIVKTTAALICTSDSHTVAGGIGQRTDMTLDEMERAFEVADQKLEDVVKVLIRF